MTDSAAPPRSLFARPRWYSGASPEVVGFVQTLPEGKPHHLPNAVMVYQNSQEKASVENGWLKFAQGADFFADLEIDVVPFINDSAELSGQTFTVPKPEFGSNPHVWMSWHPGGHAKAQGHDSVQAQLTTPEWTIRRTPTRRTSPARETCCSRAGSRPGPHDWQGRGATGSIASAFQQRAGFRPKR